MSAARRPKNWEWFFRIGRGTSTAQHVDTQYQPPASPATRGVIRTGDEKVATQESPDAAHSSIDELAWSHVIADLSDASLHELQQVVRVSRRGDASRLDENARQRLLSDLDRSWSAVSVSDLTAPGASTAPPIDVDSLRLKWREPLVACIAGQQLDTDDLKKLETLDDVLDQLACGHIKDNTAFRHDEAMAWHRALADLQSASDDALKKRTVGEVSFLQLFDQSHVYRCRTVSISGYVRRIERVPAKQPYLGISELYRLWIKPSDGTDAPFVVYCIELPEGLPQPTPERPAVTRDPPGEFVTIHGVFFKRWLYQGANASAFLAPLLLTRRPFYQAPEAEASETPSDPWRTIRWTALVAGLFAVAFTWYVWRMRPREDQPAAVRRLAELRSKHAGSSADEPDNDVDALPRIES